MNARPRVFYGLGITLLLVALLCSSCGTKMATDIPGAGPLLSLLGGIPQDPISPTTDFVYFADYSAMESAYTATRPADAGEFADLGGAGEPTEVWWVIVRNAWSYSDYVWGTLGTMPEMVGFSALDVDRAVQFGAPPSNGLILAGSFDADAIGAAYRANMDLAPTEFDGTTVWTWDGDAEGGFLTDLGNIVRENPFGGYLGRRQPMIIADESLMSSADLDVVLAHAGAVAGTVLSLADDPGYRAAVDAAGQGADILQAAIAGPMMAQLVASVPLGGDLLSPERAGSVLDAMLADYQELPPYELLIVADAVAGDEQIARLGLVYRDAQSAEAAAPILLDRLATYPSITGRSFAELLERLSVTTPRSYVRQEADRAVLVLEFPTPKATPGQIVPMLDAGYEAAVTPPGLVYRLFLNMFAQRDTSWLSTATRAELEAAAGLVTGEWSAPVDGLEAALRF